ncbi:MAG: hypothetical protein IIT97_03730, partial [Mycoplasmataceae bacterium]|nr:hypothetical protein [Mycoplasmataceae bacterium]
YAWDPSNKPWQEKLITQNLSNGKTNPQYNPLINPNTGSINQILWVNGPTPLFNNKTPEPYFADPLDPSNELYPQNQAVKQSDLGYIADAEVFNKGVEVDWNTNNANVYREGLTLSSDGKLIPSANPNSEFESLNIGNWKQIYPNNSNNNSTDYFSYSGLWEYTTLSLYNGNNYLPQNTGIYSYYLIDVINSNNEQQINKFTNVVDASNVVPFWTSYHGIHLANYLKTNENMTTSQIQKLNYAQVQYWWNNYCSSVDSSTISNSEPFNLASCSLNHIYLNNANEEQIKNIIDNEVINVLSAYNLVLNADYTINITKQQLEDLANYQSDKDGTYTTNITVTSINNLACCGTLNIAVTDSINDLNLNDIVFGQVDTGVVGNSQTDIATLEQSIINQIQMQINSYCDANNIKTKFLYGQNWTINWSNIDSLLLINNKLSALAFIQISGIQNTNCSGYNQILVDNNKNFANTYNFLDLGYINVPNLLMNLVNKNINYLTIEISNYIFYTIQQAFNEYFAKNKINPVIESELNYSWVNNKNYSSSEMQYPSTFNEYWTINNYTNLINQLVNNVANKSFSNQAIFYITPTQKGTSNLCGMIPFIVYNSNTNKVGVTSSTGYYYPNIYYPHYNSGEQYPFQTDSSSNKINTSHKHEKSLPEWVVPVIVVSIIVLSVIIAAIVIRIKDRKFI